MSNLLTVPDASISRQSWHSWEVRIALVSTHTSPHLAPGSGDAGGLNVVVAETATRLRALGHSVEIVTAESALTRLGPVDVIHAHYWTSAVAALPVARQVEAAFVVSLHTVAAVKNALLPAGERPEGAERLAAEQALVAAADAVIASGPFEARALVEAYGADAAKVHVVAPGVDHAVFFPAPARRSAADGVGGGDQQAQLAVIGRIQPLKGQDLAIRALSELPAGVNLTVAGAASGRSGAAYLASLRDLVAARGLGGRIDFAGALARDKVAALLRSSALCLLPSTSETFGLVALEAAACGVPVVASRTSGLADSVVDGVTGILVPGRDERVWAAAIGALLDDDAGRTRLAEHAAVHAESFDWKLTAARLESIYRLVV